MTTFHLRQTELEVPKKIPGRARRRRGSKLFSSVLVLLMAGGAAYGVWWRVDGQRQPDQYLTHVVQPIDLRVTAQESGTIESSSSVKVLSAVEDRVAIIFLVPEGTTVAAGDVVVELESSGLRTRLTEQQIAVEKAGASHSQAEQQLVFARSQADSDIRTAELALEFAGLDLEKYIKGEYPLALRSLQTETALAEEELERARVQLQVSEDLHRDNYLTQGELEADRFRATRAQFQVEIAKEKERLLREYTFPRAQRDLDSKVAEAGRTLERVKSLAQASVDQAEKNLAAAGKTLHLEERKLTHFDEQIGKCTMRATQAGVVVYPIPEDDDAVELYIKEGTIIRERQHVFSIADTDVLQVSTAIHEAMVNQIKPGLKARIWVDVYPDLVLRGEVKHVSPLPQPEDWRRTTVKFYETKVSILDHHEGLRPGMSTKVEILIEEQPDVLALPVQSVVQRGKTGLCYVLAGGRPELRRVRLGKSNFQYIAVQEGLSAGEQVLLSPDVLGIPASALEEEEPAEPGGEGVVLAAETQPTPAEGGATGPATGDATAAEAVQEAVQEIEYVGVLVGPDGAVAEVEFQTTTTGSLVEYEFEVKIMNGAPNATLDVTVDGVGIGSVTLDAAGSCDIEWSSEDGTFPANFPLAAAAGTSVQIGDLQGAFAP